mmetsp:Transcript_782/g.1848  ORF Transcript_782/g.1848 Transcript_782/m.1848 type:complete len:250 (-) Transcript_782:693-1442(-)
MEHVHASPHPVMHLTLRDWQSRKETELHEQPPAMRTPNLHRQRIERLGIPPSHLLEQAGVGLRQRLQIPFAIDRVGELRQGSHCLEVGEDGQTERGGEAEHHESPRSLLHAPRIKGHAVGYALAGKVTPSIASSSSVGPASSVLRGGASHGVIRHATRIGRVAMPLEGAVGAHGELGHGAFDFGGNAELSEGQAFGEGAAAPLGHCWDLALECFSVVVVAHGVGMRYRLFVGVDVIGMSPAECRSEWRF